MLFAQRENEKQPAAKGDSRGLASLGTLEKVLESIQGLRQRLRDIPLEDIIEVESQAQIVTERLAVLRKELETFEQIKKLLDKLNEVVESQEGDAAPAMKSGSSKMTVPHHPVAHPNNLILFPRSNRLLKETESPTAPVFIANPHPSSEAPQAQAKVSQQENHLPEQQPENPRLETPESTVAAQLQFAPDESDCKDLPVSVDIISLPDQTVKDTNEAIVRSTPSSEAILDQTFTEAPPSLEEPVEFSIPDQSVKAPSHKTDDNHTVEFDRNGTQPPKNAQPRTLEFDQQLLEDLIKDYGEFAAYASLSSTVETPQPTVQPEIHPSPQYDRPVSKSEESANKALIRYRNDGDLDRQLKKLIKDYGEYDLYSHRTTVNLKKSVIAAFILLGVVFFGFYFVSSRHPLEPLTRPSSLGVGITDETTATQPPDGLPPSPNLEGLRTGAVAEAGASANPGTEIPAERKER